MPLEDLRHALYRPVALLVPQRVVEKLEIIYVYQEKPEVFLVLPCPAEPFAQDGVQVAGVP